MVLTCVKKTRAWGVSAVATVAATYALDLMATAAGVGLVATGLLAHAGRGWLIVILVLSYGGWACGMWANVRANSALLAVTGLSTNVFSKAAHDLVRRLAGGERAQRFAAGAGYVGTELVKEAPYYLGAFGVAAVSAPVTTDEALVFLVGANVGAFAYEYGVARLTRRYLRRGHATGAAPLDAASRDGSAGVR